jgi:hypothetical protein
MDIFLKSFDFIPLLWMGFVGMLTNVLQACHPYLPVVLSLALVGNVQSQKYLFLAGFANSQVGFHFGQGSILLWLASRGGSSGISGWTVSNNGDAAVICIIAVAVPAHLQQYW